MEVRAKKHLGQHFLTDQKIAQNIVEALILNEQQEYSVLEIGPGMGVLTQYLITKNNLDLKLIEIDAESVEYLKKNYPGISDKLYHDDFLKLRLHDLFKGSFSIIGNFPYNISSQIFFKILDNYDSIPQIVCMLQKEVAERIAETPGTKTYGILSVLLQTWYDIEYLFTVGQCAFAPPPKVQSAVIRLKRNSRKTLNCNPSIFKSVVKLSFNQRRKTIKNSLNSLIKQICKNKGLSEDIFTSEPIFQLRPERLSVEDFIELSKRFE